MMNTTDEGRMHFSPAINEWADCDATQKKCQYEHITKAEHNALVQVQEQEALLVDSNMGKAEVSYIQAKTSMSSTEIQELLRELKREGSLVPKPTEAELKKFIEQEHFKVEHDGTLTAKEKRAILKNLKQAEKDLEEQGNHQISGGVFHAWKNGITTAFNRVKKPLLAGALIGSLSFGLAACAPTGDTKAPEKEGTGGTSEVVTAGADCVDGSEVAGDAILGKKLKNEKGEYCSIVVNPDSPALKYDKTKTDAKLYELGYTDAQLEQVQKDAVAFTVASLVDNPKAGQSTDVMLDWITKEGPNQIDKVITDAYTTNRNDNAIQGFDVTFSSDKLIPPLVHDGGAREAQVTVSVNGIRPKTPPAGVTLADESTRENPEVMMTVTTSYRVVPDTYKEWRKGMLVNMGKGEYQNVVDEETSDFTKPLFYDHTKDINVSYSKSDVQSNAKGMKVRSITSNVDTNISMNAESYNK